MKESVLRRFGAQMTVAGAVAALLFLLPGARVADAAWPPSNFVGTRLAQAEAPGDEQEVSPQDFEKYIAVYKATQKNHSLTVEQAAEQQGLTIAQFRELEAKIERDDTLREKARRRLRNSSSSSSD